MSTTPPPDPTKTAPAAGGLTDLLPGKLRPFAKAIWPALGAVIAVAATWAATGSFDSQELAIGITGLVFSVVAYRIPNTRNSPAAKALYPGVLSLIGALVTAMVEGNVDTASLRVAVTGLVAAGLTYAVPNKPAPPEAPPAAPSAA